MNLYTNRYVVAVCRTALLLSFFVFPLAANPAQEQVAQVSPSPVSGVESRLTDPKMHTHKAELKPVLTCVAKIDDNHFSAVFGYTNSSSAGISVPIGEENEFEHCRPEYSGQPTYFRPSVHPGVFSVDFDGRETVVWKLDNEIAIATRSSPSCPLQCPPSQGTTAGGQCLDLEIPQNVLKEEDVVDAGPTFGSQTEAEAYIIDKVAKFNLGHAFHSLSGGLLGDTPLSGNAFVSHENGPPEVFDDKFALVIGGRAGTINVGGTEICVNDRGCEFDPPTNAQSARSQPDPTSCDREFCIDGNSFTSDFPPLVPFYHSVNGETSQSRGGYQVDHHVCLKYHVIPWICTSKHGTNDLMVSSTFLNSAGAELSSGFAFGHDKTSVKTKIWSIFADINFSGTGTRFGDDITVSGGCADLLAPTLDCRVERICSNHSGDGNSTSRTGPVNRVPQRFASGDCAPLLIP
jgi:hypothetical protein